MIEIIKNTMQEIETFSERLNHPIKIDDYFIEDLGCPHKLSKLKNGYGAVYLFFYKDIALKVGKANKKAAYRFNYQHYGFNASSTLAKSLCGDEEFVQMGITNENIKEWILQNTHRINIQIGGKDVEAATELIEAVFHFQFRPRYEGVLLKKRFQT